MSKPSHLYPSQVFWSDEDGGFIATAPDLPGCSAFGATEAEALAELKDAIAAWISAATAAGNPIPAPSRPRPAPQASGRILLRLPKELHATLLRNSEQQATSLNQYAVHLLTAAVTGQVVAQAVSTAIGAHRLSAETTQAVSTTRAATAVQGTTAIDAAWRTYEGVRPLVMASTEDMASLGRIILENANLSSLEISEHQTEQTVVGLFARTPFSGKVRSQRG